MVRPAGFGPATCGLENRCSIQLSYGRPFFASRFTRSFEGQAAYYCFTAACPTKLREAERSRKLRAHDTAEGGETKNQRLKI